VRNVLALLKPEYSQALLMSSGGFTCKEMSGVLGMKTDSLYVLLGRARAKFEQEYLRIYGRQQ
jgi:DNA-directed RNA polymerase specialized sigma24 family protein